MFAVQRSACLKQVSWNEPPTNSRNNNSITVLECFKTAGIATAERDVDFRLLRLVDEPREKQVQHGETESKLMDWLHFKKPYTQLAPAQGAGKSEGGIRLVFCDRPGPRFGMTMSKVSFQAIETTFNLHPVTLPAFFVNGGSITMFRETSSRSNNAKIIHIVAKSCQKAELGNMILSLSYDLNTGWTNAFICGDGILCDRPNFDSYFGSQLEQWVDLVTSSPQFWNNPIFLPSALLQIYSQRTQLRLWWTDDQLIDLENQLGVTNAARATSNAERKAWPQDIDPKKLTKSLHSLLTHVIYMSSCCKWLRNSCETLLELEEQLRSDAGFQQHNQSLRELRESTSYIFSVSKTYDQYFTAFKERTTVQVNVLFSIISQQESLLNRWDSQLSLDIARASKRDSISMTTFTFITAIFLPGSFVATLFSMTMFNWQSDNNNSSSSNNNNNGQLSSQSSNVSNKFWIFWAIAVPLTLITLGTWFFWFRYASKKWEERFRPETKNGVFPDFPESAQSPTTAYPFNLASDNWNAPRDLFSLAKAVSHKI